MEIELQLPPEDIETIATIFARGYLRCTDRDAQECLANSPDSSRHGSAVNASENDQQQAAIATAKEER